MRRAKAERVIGFDASTYVDPIFARWMLERGYEFVVRYIRLDRRVNTTPDAGWPVSLSHAELAELLEVGLKVSLVQFPGGRPSAEKGHRHGDAAGHNACALGARKGTTVWCDCEYDNDYAKADIQAYLNAWSAAVVGHGCAPGLYVGPGINLDADDLYALPRFRSYWKSASWVPFPAVRGVQMIQTCEYIRHGSKPSNWWLESINKKNRDGRHRIDANCVCMDAFGDRFYWIAP